MTQDPKRWQKVNDLLKKAIELTSNEQQAFVSREANGDEELVAEVMALLQFDSEKTGNIRESIQSVASDLHAADEIQYVGEQVGRYRITAKLAEGGMGSVFVAEHTASDFDQTVAIKLLPKHRFNEDALRRFVDERRILAGLQHPNIAALIDGGTLADGTPYIVMEHIKGLAIDQYCSANDLSNNEIITLVRTVCSALQYAHRKLVIHRDIKPSNILVAQDGTPKLLDFGIAKLLDDDVDAHVTKVDQRILTPMYASPEQLEGVPITTAADVYGIGLLLYRLLTGQMPYVPTGETPRDLEFAILSQDPQRPSTAVRTGSVSASERPEQWLRHQQRALRGELDTILLTSLQKKPERRYESIAAFSEDLKRFQLDLPIAARPDSPLYLMRKFLRRNRWPASFAAAAVATGVGLIYYYTGQLRIERDVANETASFLTDMFQASDPYMRNKDGLTVDALVDEGLNKLNENDDLSAEVRVRLLSTIAQVKRNLGELSSASEIAEKALALAESDSGPDSELVLPALSNLIQVRRAQDDDATAMTMAKRMLRISEKTKGKKSPEVAQATHLLAILAYRLGDLEAMGEWTQRTYKLRNDIYAANSKEVSTGANAMGLYYWQINDVVSARSYYEESAAIQASQPERNLMSEASLLHNIGLLYNDSGDYAQAIERYSQSIKLRRQAGSPNDTILPMTLYSLAHSQSRYGDKVSAHQTFLEQLPLQVAIAGREKHFVAYSLTGHGLLLEEMGALDKAEQLLTEADRIFSLLPDKQHRDRAATWIGLARLAASAGEFDRAETLVQQAVDLRKENNGEEDTGTLRARIALGRIVFLSGDYDRADAIMRSVQSALENEGHEEHPYMAEALSVHGRNALANSDAELAVSLFEKARAVLSGNYPDDHHIRAQYAMWHVEALEHAGRADDAEALRKIWQPRLSAAKADWQSVLSTHPVPTLDEYLVPADSGS